MEPARPAWASWPGTWLGRPGVRVVLAAATRSGRRPSSSSRLWAERAGASFVKGARGRTSGSVAYDAIATARRDGADVVIIDTAGRLHTQDDLMAELGKGPAGHRQADPGGPARDIAHGRRHHRPERTAPGQAFSEASRLTGLILTKLDGTAKGGIALAIAQELGIPVKLIGVGEQLEDLRPSTRESRGRWCPDPGAPVVPASARRLPSSLDQEAHVRFPCREAPGDPVRGPRPRHPDRGRHQGRDARGPLGAARGRRQLQGGQEFTPRSTSRRSAPTSSASSTPTSRWSRSSPTS